MKSSHLICICIVSANGVANCEYLFGEVYYKEKGGFFNAYDTMYGGIYNF